MIENQDYIIITAQPDSRFFVWETEIQINNLRKWGISNKLNVLVYWDWQEHKPHVNMDWLDLRSKYPEVKFHFYKEDKEDLNPDIIKYVYKSVIRPFCLKKFWTRYPETKDKTVVYIDGDVLFMHEPPIDEWCKGDTCYVSDTRGYLGVDYMRNKAKEVNLPENHFIKLGAELTGIEVQDILDNDEHCGGAQYVLKGITADFWQKVQDDCVNIKQRFAIENQRYYVQKGIERGLTTEDAGIQSWCADMWAVLYNLYYFKKEVKSPESMKFTWATDELNDTTRARYFLHNAGAGSGNNHFLFDKSRYRWGQTYMDRWPWQEDLSYVSPKFASSLYVEAIKETYKDKIT